MNAETINRSARSFDRPPTPIVPAVSVSLITGPAYVVTVEGARSRERTHHSDHLRTRDPESGAGDALARLMRDANKMETEVAKAGAAD